MTAIHERVRHPLRDPFGRSVDYLRISITDRCNERCLYCAPEGYKGWARKEDHLTSDEIVRCVETAIQLGFRKFRITGGEPLIRRDAIEILERVGRLSGVETLGLSTNGTRLAALARPIRKADVDSINISLDALDPQIYSRVTGGRIADVLEGIHAAKAECFAMLKLNCVLLRGVNESEYMPLIEFAATHDLILRFIELMPVSAAGALRHDNFFSIPELMRRLGTEGNLSPREDFRPGHGPARYWKFTSPHLDRPVRLGFIGALTTPRFCAECDKLRLTADGHLRPCLGRHGEVDLRAALRANGDVGAVFRKAVAGKPESHEFLESYAPGRPMTAIGG